MRAKPGHVPPAERATPPVASERRFTVRLDKWTPCVRGALKGFARISVEELGLRIDGIAVSQRSDGQWGIMLPGRPLLDGERNLILDEHGKPVYVWTLAFCDPRGAEAFEAGLSQTRSVFVLLSKCDAMLSPQAEVAIVEPDESDALRVSLGTQNRQCLAGTGGNWHPSTGSTRNLALFRGHRQVYYTFERTPAAFRLRT